MAELEDFEVTLKLENDLGKLFPDTGPSYGYESFGSGETVSRLRKRIETLESQLLLNSEIIAAQEESISRLQSVYATLLRENLELKNLIPGQ